MKQREGEFEFDFTSAVAVMKLDDPGKQKPEGMQLVDFVLEEAQRRIMLEVKDPSCEAKGKDSAAAAAIVKSRQDFMKKVQHDTLIAEELAPKARDSYSYLHLMKQDDKPILYAFLLGAEKLGIDDGLLMGFKDRLLARLRKEADQPWTRRYVADCLVLTEQTWSLAFPQYPLSRIP